MYSLKKSPRKNKRQKIRMNEKNENRNKLTAFNFEYFI
jgi:hypothetical protein